MSGCGSSAQEQEINKLKEEISKLKAELDDAKYGATILLQKAKSEVNSNNLVQAQSSLQELIKRHPETPEANSATPLLIEVKERILAVETAKKKEEEKRKIAERLALEKAEKNLKKNHDEIDGITWVSHKNTPIFQKYAALYFGTKNGSASNYPIRLKLFYYSDNWLFVEGVTIKADEHTFELPNLKFERDNGSGSIWEWSDAGVNDHAMLNAILDAKRVVIRFNGHQYRSDFILPKSQQDAMRETYAAWKKYGGKI